MKFLFKFLVLFVSWVVTFLFVGNVLFNFLVMNDGSYTSTDLNKWGPIINLAAWVTATVCTYIISQEFFEG